MPSLRELKEELGLPLERFTPDYTLPAEDYEEGKEVEEFVKTSAGVFIPGSSLKGFFRTAIFYHLLKNFFVRRFKEEYAKGGWRQVENFALCWKNKLFADKPLDEDCRGRQHPAAREDALKFLAVSDGNPLSPEGALKIKKLKNSRGSLEVFAEVLAEGVVSEVEVCWNGAAAEEFLNRYWKNAPFRLKEFWKSLTTERVLEIGNAYARAVVEFEIWRREQRRRFRNRGGAFDMLERLRSLMENASLSVLEELRNEEGYLIRIGKYTGRYSHSVMVAIWETDRKFFEERIWRFNPSKTYWEVDGKPLGFGVLKALN
jgi:CRISPR type III-A-associated RAMP protein Csm5